MSGYLNNQCTHILGSLCRLYPVPLAGFKTPALSLGENLKVCNISTSFVLGT